MLLLPFLAFLAFEQSYATLSNITIDDTNSTFWTFVGSYHAVTSTTSCSICLAQPDPGLAYNSTWHDSELGSGSFVFQGTAVYIFGIDFLNPANVSFVMSNPTVNNFHDYSGTTYVYNSLFFSATNLDANVEHTVTWLMQRSSGGGVSALFYYAIVTLDIADTSSSATGGASSTGSTFAPSASADTSSSSATDGASSTRSASVPRASASSSPSAAPATKSKTGSIIGAVVGVVVGLALLATLISFYLRRRRSAGASVGGINTEHNVDERSDLYGSGRAARVAQYAVEPYQLLSITSLQPIVHSKTSNTTSTSASMSAVSMTAVPSESASLERPPVPTVLAREPNNTSGQHVRNLEVEERLWHLEELVAASQPPSYS
ncbi:hypothetical protein MSAN_02185400 [Mycena sanguinolenta]|uniref:Uncharacterized protein n=1 Tax=Mycena sanguinolenta TaxID=230812 RepID=A0A8H7CJE2_9AGAR|nr:hypothetical protein MSAN_02185400 [Mycena sanguinolenta]